MRSWGPRTREELENWLGRAVILNSYDATSHATGRYLCGGPTPRRATAH